MGKLSNNIDVCSIEGKQSDLYRGNNIILSHVDCLCLQGKKEDKARSILRSQYFGNRLSNETDLTQEVKVNKHFYPLDYLADS